MIVCVCVCVGGGGGYVGVLGLWMRASYPLVVL